jgi:hypothetical protein
VSLHSVIGRPKISKQAQLLPLLRECKIILQLTNRNSAKITKTLSLHASANPKTKVLREYVQKSF